MSELDLMRRRLADATAGEYDILGELGRGGMATVYLAHDRSLDRRVAIKVMSPQLAAVDGMAERFLLEARVAAALAHPNIVPIHAVRRSGDLLYFVMRYVAGRSLDAVLAESGPLDVAVVCAVLRQVGAALEAAHCRGIIHRDIKPANILIDERGDAVVADFGIARVAARRGMTQVGETVGTPEYMSPEQCAGEALTGAADQYSLGVVAYELLSGAPPFTGAGLMQVVWRMVNEEIVPLEERRPDCAGALAAAVHRMLAHRADERWPFVADAISALPTSPQGTAAAVRNQLAALSRTAAPPTVEAGVARRRASAATEVAHAHATAHATTATAIRRPSDTAMTIRLPFASGVMTIDDEVSLTAVVADASGADVSDAELTWHSSDTSIARVTGRGVLRAVLRAVHTGGVLITVSVGEVSTCLDLLVTRAGVRDLAVVPRPSVIEVGDRFALAVSAGAAGRSEGTPARPRLVAWRSSDEGIAAVDANGVVVALAVGSVDITARAGGGATTLSLRVTRAVIATVHVSLPAPRLSIGDRMTLQAEPSNPKGYPLSGYRVRWEVSDPGVAAISPEGVLTALRSGQVLVAARVEGRVGTAKVMVAPRA